MADKEKIVKQELRKFKKIFEALDENKRKIAEDLYSQAAFIKATLAELQEAINADGAVITAINGNGFKVTTEHPAQKSYNTMIKNYNAIMKTLGDLAPDAAGTDELLNFLSQK